MKKSTKKNAQINNAENIIQKNEKCDDYCKNQNIMLKKKNIIDISIFNVNKLEKKIFEFIQNFFNNFNFLYYQNFN